MRSEHNELLQRIHTYDLPFGRGRTFGSNMNRAADLSRAVGRSTPSCNSTMASPSLPRPTTTPERPLAFPELTAVAHRSKPPRRHRPLPGNPGYQWFSPSSVSQPTSGFGNCQVGSFTGPGLQAIDFSVSKNFAIVEQQSLQFRAEAINVSEPPHPGGSQLRIGQTFGLVNNAQGERQLQFALKYMF